MAQQKVRIKIPKEYNPRERKAISREVVDFIISRTKNGQDKNNKKFNGYTEDYAESAPFKAFGKSKAKVNLTLTGEMLEELDPLSQRSGFITVGYDKSDKELNGKVEGNIKGTYGSKKADKSKAKDFLGISKKDLKKILERYPIRNKNERTLRVDAVELAEEEGISLSEAMGLVDDEI